MMTRMLRDKIGHTSEVYVDDMVVESKRKEGHIDDLKEVVEMLRRHKLCLKPLSNPKEIQVLTSMLAALNQFIPSLPTGAIHFTSF